MNKDTKKFFRAIKKDKLDHYAEEISGYGYQTLTIQELIVDLMENSFLFRTTSLYMEYEYADYDRRIARAVMFDDE